MGNIDEGNSARYEFGGSIIRETENAWLIRLDNGDELFFPKSQTDWEGHELWSIPHWLAEEKGLE